MNGQKGLTIVVIALLLTVCIGFLFNAEQQPTAKTVYEDKADLSALMALNSTRENLTEEYNSNYNVIGWDPVDGIPVTTTPNYYIISPRVINYTPASVTLNYDSVERLSGSLSQYVSPDKITQKTTNNTEFTSGDTYASGNPFNGGTWGKTSQMSISFTRTFKTLDEDLNETTTSNPITISNGSRVQWDNILSLISTPTDGSRIYFSEQNLDFNFFINVSASSTYTNNRNYAISWGGTNFNVVGDAYNNSFYQWNNATEKWDVYLNDILKLQSVDLFVYSMGVSSNTITVNVPDVVPATYADPTKLVHIDPATFSTPIEDLPSWSNTDYNDTLVNASVSMIIKGSTVIYAAGATITVNEVSGNYSVGSTVIGAYPNGIVLTLNAQTSIITVEGILTTNTAAPATDYVTAGFTYELGWSPTTAEITKISFRSFSGFDAYIVRTIVYTDPNELLWINPTLNLNSYFSSIINSEGGARVIFNGFVSYGDTLTINSQTFTVSEGKITVPYDHGNGAVPTQFKISGMAIDYTPAGVNLVFTEDGNKTVSLGAIVDYIIAGTGAWYYSAHILQINHISGLEWVWVNGWTLSVNQTCAVMLGLMVVGLLIGLYFGRGSLDSYDWIIMILAALAVFSLMVV